MGRILPLLLFGFSLLYGERFHVVQEFHIARPEVKLWVPLPQDSSYQKVSNLTVEGNYDQKQVGKDPVYGADILHLAFPPGQKENRARMAFTVEVEDRHGAVPSVPLRDGEKARYLNGTAHLPADGVVKKYADKITAGAENDGEKARKVYDWVVENMFRDPKVRGCGLGDARKSLESGYLGGKCADVSAVFVALLRASDIPAREVFGIRVAPSRFSKAYGTKSETITTAQHCRAEFYLEGKGWIPADPADVTKLILVEGLERNDPKALREKERQFGSWEMNWIAYNSARDFVLVPEPLQFPLSIFSYPYAETGDEPLDYYDPDAFAYTITAEPLP